VAGEPWECIIVGGGAAGLSAALVLGRARRRTLVVDAGEQSNRPAEGIGGLLGHDHRRPDDLYRAGRDELTAYPSVEYRAARVTRGAERDGAFHLELDDGARESSRAVLLATGMDYRLPDVPGVAERWGRSVFHCPFCHGWEVRDRALGVLDGSDRAAQRALLLRFWSDDVTLYMNGASEFEPSETARLRRAGVQIDERVVRELRGRGPALEAIALTDGSERSCQALLVPAPLRQRSTLAAELGAALADPSFPDGPMLVDARYGTSVRGLYAAGDVSAQALPSVAGAVAAGSDAAKAIVQDLVAEAFPRATT